MGAPADSAGFDKGVPGEVQTQRRQRDRKEASAPLHPPYRQGIIRVAYSHDTFLGPDSKETGPGNTPTTSRVLPPFSLTFSASGSFLLRDSPTAIFCGYPSRLMFFHVFIAGEHRLIMGEWGMPQGCQIGVNDNKGCKEIIQQNMKSIDNLNTSQEGDILFKIFDPP